MLSFLNSIVLPALLAVGIPLIIHFFNRRKAHKIKYSSIRFLKYLENQRIRQVRLYQILLIIIRMLFILFLILAFARPTLKSSLLESSAAARCTAVIIPDNSYSMKAYVNSNTFFDMASEQLKQVMLAFNANDLVFILQPTETGTNHRPVDLTQSPRLKISNDSPGFDGVFRSAHDIFSRYPNPNRELFVISDFRISHKAVHDSISSFFKDMPVRIYLLAPSTALDFNNVSIDTVIIKNQLFEVNRPVQIKIRLQNHNLNEAAETTVNLYNADVRVAMELAVIEAGSGEEIEMTFVPKASGLQLLQVEIADDDLLLDNYYYLNFPIKDKIEVLLVDDIPALPLKSALEVISTNTALNIQTTDFSRWQGLNFNDYDLLILSNPHSLGAETHNRLSSYLSAGKNIIVAPGAQTDIKEINAFGQAFCGQPLFLEFKSVTAEQSYFSLESITDINALFNPSAALQQPVSENAKIYKYFRTNPAAQHLLRLKNNDAFLTRFSTKEKNSHLFIFCTMFDFEWTDLPAKTYFIPFLYQMLHYTSSRQQGVNITVVNRDIPVVLSNLSLDANYEITRKGADPYPTIPEQTPQGLRFSFANLEQPGNYLLTSGPDVLYAFSVNLSSRELQRPYVDFSELSGEVIRINPSDKIAVQISGARRGQELWIFFLALALTMIALEMVIIKRIEGKEGRT